MGIPSAYFEYEEKRSAIEQAFQQDCQAAREKHKRSMATIKARRDDALVQLAAGLPVRRGSDYQSAGREPGLLENEH